MKERTLTTFLKIYWNRIVRIYPSFFVAIMIW